MATRHFKAARLKGGNAPQILFKPIPAAQTFKIGAIMIEDTAVQGDIKEGATGALADIHGIATQAVDTTPGFELGHSSQVKQVTSRKDEIPIYVADADTVFSGVDSAVAATALMVDLEFGLRKDADGIWTIDTTDVTNVAVKVFDVDVEEDILFFRFLVSALPIGV